LENGVSQVEEAAGRFPQVSGLKYTADLNKPAGSRITAVEVKEGNAFVALDPNKVYGVATNNYMRSGGDGYEVFATGGQNAYDFGPGLEAVVADYISKNSPYKPYTDGRITVIASTAAAETATDAAAPAAPAAPAATEAPAATAPAAPVTEAAAATAASVYKVVAGDSLWKIAKATYGDGLLWTKIAEANTLRNPNVISIGSELQLPAK
ncbi:MAG: 5'-nucleotidase C-terminal domain-containing protein, partial [Allorhizobium sp.]